MSDVRISCQAVKILHPRYSYYQTKILKSCSTVLGNYSKSQHQQKMNMIKRRKEE